MYINGFGSRPMVEIYPLLALPFASFIAFVWNKRLLITTTLACLLFFVFINIFQTWQLHKGLIWTEEGNFAFYKSMFLKKHGTPESLIAFDTGEEQPDISSIHFTKLLKTESYEDSVNSNYVTDIKTEKEFAYELRNSETKKIKFIASKSIIKPNDYIKVSCDVYLREMEWNKFQLAVLNTVFFHNGNIIRDRRLRLPSKIGNTENSIWYFGKTNEWSNVSYFVKVPHRFISSNDILEINVWNPGNKVVVIDNLKIELWKNN